MSREEVSWIGVDWGTSNLRAWIMGWDDKPLETLSSTQGMGKLEPEMFEPVLIDLVKDYFDEKRCIPVLICGMAGARQGWKDAGYLTTPCRPPTAHQAVQVETKDHRVKVSILPGVRQLDPPDVMRGEETQLAAFLENHTVQDLLYCLPGTHCKWVEFGKEKITRFKTFMTGELFAAIKNHTILRHSVAENGSAEAFATGVMQGLQSPQTLTTDLFSIRAEALLGNAKSKGALSKLSGLLIGAELAGAKQFWIDKKVTLVGKGELVNRYGDAFRQAKIRYDVSEAENEALLGLKNAFYADKPGIGA